MDLRAVETALTAGDFRFTEHAREQMAKCQLGEDDVRKVLAGPEEVLQVRKGRIVAQAMLSGYLLRVFVDIIRKPLEVVTAYRTSKIDYYRSQP
jgi:hypothetical protein